MTQITTKVWSLIQSQTSWSVKWALGSITTNKASGCDKIPAELFKNLKDDAVEVLHSICQQIWKAQQWPPDWKRSVFIPIPKKGNAKECSNYCTAVFISHVSKVRLKSQARPQQYVNQNLPDVKAGFRKGRGTRDQTANIHWIIEKATEFQKSINFCFIDYTKVLTLVLSHFSRVRLFATPQTVACQASLFMGFSRNRYQSGLPFTPPGDLPNPQIEPTSLISPALAGGFFTTSATSLLFFDCGDHNKLLKYFPGGSGSKESAHNVGDPGSIPGSGRSPGEGNGAHSSILAWRIPRTEEPGELWSKASQQLSDSHTHT